MPPKSIFFPADPFPQPSGRLFTSYAHLHVLRVAAYWPRPLASSSSISRSRVAPIRFAQNTVTQSVNGLVHAWIANHCNSCMLILPWRYIFDILNSPTNKLTTCSNVGVQSFTSPTSPSAQNLLGPYSRFSYGWKIARAMSDIVLVNQKEKCFCDFVETANCQSHHAGLAS